MTATFDGLVDWSLDVDEEGYRNYTAVHRVITNDPEDGPYTIMATPGLPSAGSTWTIGNDDDPWSFCTRGGKVSLEKIEDSHRQWLVGQTFTNRPKSRCQTTTIDNPLLEPARISGSFVKFTKEATVDRFGDPILNSAFERIRGKVVERDHNRPTVRIGLNLATINLNTICAFNDCVNDATLWNLAAHCVKLSNISWQRLMYGTCTYYFTVEYEFEIDFKTWKRELVDEGTKELKVGGTATNPAHFRAAVDERYLPTTKLLNGAGQPLGAGEDPYIFTKELYEPKNLLLLGIPTTFI